MRRGLAQVDLLAENDAQIPFLCRFHAKNYRSPYAYQNLGTATAVVVDLREDQVSFKFSYLLVCDCIFALSV